MAEQTVEEIRLEQLKIGFDMAREAYHDQLKVSARYDEKAKYISTLSVIISAFLTYLSKEILLTPRSSSLWNWINWIITVEWVVFFLILIMFAIQLWYCLLIFKGRSIEVIKINENYLTFIKSHKTIENSYEEWIKNLGKINAENKGLEIDKLKKLRILEKLQAWVIIGLIIFIVLGAVILIFSGDNVMNNNNDNHTTNVTATKPENTPVKIDNNTSLGGVRESLEQLKQTQIVQLPTESRIDGYNFITPPHKK